jgi:signal transduction histidine kinase
MQSSGQAGQEVGLSVPGDIQAKQAPSGEGSSTSAKTQHRRAFPGAAGELTHAGKDHYKHSDGTPKELREMVTMLSHDLRTPLTSIHGTLSLLRLGACGELPPQALQAIQIAERGSTRLLKLINDLLDIERIESGHLPIAIRTTSTQAIIVKSVEAIAGLAEQHNMQLQLPQQDLEIDADEDRLVQVLVNLLSNAINYSPDASRIVVHICNTQNGVEFSVSDQGPGIPADRSRDLFERWKQVETISAGKLNGSGLGLSICKAIVYAHGGRIGFQNRLHGGSTFWFSIPAQPVRSEAASA